MRSLLSWRLWAAVAALVLIALVLNGLLIARRPVATLGVSSPVTRRVDLAELVLGVRTDDFSFGEDGTTTGQLSLILAPDRVVEIYPGTPGESSCEDLERLASCAVLADMLGDAVVWFALVPVGPRFDIELPAITDLSDGYAVLSNTWNVRYAPVLRRSCDRETESFQEFLRIIGNNHVSVYDIDEQKLTEVRCGPAERDANSADS